MNQFMKKTLIILFFITMIITGCDSSTRHNVTTIAEPEQIDSNSLDGDQNINITETVEDVNTEIQISYENISLEYDGEVQKMRCFAIGHQYIYANTIKNDISGFEIIKAGESKGIQTEFTVPDDMIVLCMSVDLNGNGYALLMSFENNQLNYKNAEIWIIHPDGKKKETIDITQSICIENQVRPNMFAVSDNGIFYIVDEMRTGHIVMLNGKGHLINDIYDEYGRIFQGIGCGKSGRIYVICKDTSILIAEITEDGCLEDTSVRLPEAESKYSTAGTNISNDFLVFNLKKGVYAINMESGVAEEKIVVSDYPCDRENIAGRGFLYDGRLLLIESVEERYIFHYITL